jgi:hypothetical protein
MKENIKHFMGALLIMACVYVWWVLADGPGIMELDQVSKRVQASVYEARAHIWPFIWKKNIYGD